ncbi:MAG: sel1 repeat family protein [Verrucomicrobia bacterium]|nr:sel1 repeat family protein [Verrucomicrobiota bacterium]
MSCIKGNFDSFGLDEVVKWYRAPSFPQKLKTCAFTIAVRKWIDSSGPENANKDDAVCRLYTRDVTDREAIFAFTTKEAEGGSVKALGRLWVLIRLTRQLKLPLQEAKLFRWFREIAKNPSAPLQRAAMDRVLFFVCGIDVTHDVEDTFSTMLVADFAIFSTKDKEYLVSKLIELAKANRGRRFLSWLETLANQDRRWILVAKAIAEVYEGYGEEAQAFVWDKRAAELGDVEAMCLVGHYLNRQGNLAEALRWYKQAADKGHERAKRVVAAWEEARKAGKTSVINPEEKLTAEGQLMAIARKYGIDTEGLNLGQIWRRCCFPLHPDKTGGKSAAEIEARNKDFKLISDIKGILNL